MQTEIREKQSRVGIGLAQDSAGKGWTKCGTVGGYDKRKPRSAFLGLRVAMPLAIGLWALLVTALWTLLR